MTTLLTVPIARRPWRGSDNPALPSGMWIADGSSTGDATGGEHLISFLFRRLSEPLNGMFYSVEQISITKGGSGTLLMLMQCSGMDFLVPGVRGRELRSREWATPLTDDNVGRSLSLANGLQRSLFLGTPSGFGSATSSLTFDAPNVDGEGMGATAQGYVWSPEATLQPGGPQKPVGALWN